MIAPSTVDLRDIDAFTRGEHHKMFDWLRANDPVHWQEEPDGGGFWSLTTYDDVAFAYREHSVFSSAHGIILGGSYRNVVDTSTNQMLVSSDPPRHRQLRQVMRQAFAPNILERIRVQVGDLVDSALARAERDGGCDFAVDVAPELPSGALMAMVAIPHSDARELVELTHSMIGYRRVGEEASEDSERLRLAGIQADIFEYFADLIKERRQAPGDDLIGILLRATVNGRPMREEEMLYNCLNIAVGGNETSTHSSSDGLIALMDHPDQYESLCADPGLLETALQEILRWSSPNAYDHRVATAEVEIGGKRIDAGDSVALWTISANRDQTYFPDPHSFQITRSPNRHMSFGSGVHRCVGSALGLIELTALFSRLTRGRLRFTSAGAPERLPSNFIVGVRHLPVHLRPAP